MSAEQVEAQVELRSTILIEMQKDLQVVEVEKFLQNGISEDILRESV